MEIQLNDIIIKENRVHSQTLTPVTPGKEILPITDQSNNNNIIKCPKCKKKFLVDNFKGHEKYENEISTGLQISHEDITNKIFSKSDIGISNNQIKNIYQK